MPRTVSEHITKLTLEKSQLENELNKTRVVLDSVTRSQNKLSAANDKNYQDNKKLTTAERQLREERQKHAGVIRNLSTTTSTMVGPLNAITGRLTSISVLVGRVGIGATLMGAAFAGAIYTLNKIITGSIAAFMEMEEQQGRIQGVLRATGSVAGYTAQQLDQMARSVAADTLASTEGVRTGIAALLTFKSIQGETFEQTLRLAQDMSTVFKQDLTSSVKQLGKALEDPINNMGALSRTGVTFSEIQREQIKNAQEMGDLLRAQEIILSIVTTQVGGAAEAAGAGLAGIFDRASQSTQEFLEAISMIGAEIGEQEGGLPYLVRRITTGYYRTLDKFTEGMTTSIQEYRDELAAIDADPEFAERRIALETYIQEELRKIRLDPQYYGTGMLTFYSKQLGELTKRRRQIALYLTKVDKEQAEAEKAALDAKLEREKQAAEEQLKRNDALYAKLYAGSGSIYEKQRREQNKIHAEKLKQIEELTYTDEQAAVTSTGKYQTAAELKKALIEDLVLYNQQKLDEIDQKEQNKIDADINRVRRETERKREILSGFNAWVAGTESDALSRVDKWYQDQLNKLAKFRSQAEAEGIQLDDKDAEKNLEAERDRRETEVLREESLKRLKIRKDAAEERKRLEMDYKQFMDRLKGDEFTALDLEYEQKLAKLMNFLENKIITEEQFKTSSEELDRAKDEDILRAKFNDQQQFADAVIKLKKGQAGAEMGMAAMVAEQLSTTSKKAFAIKKALAIKDTLMATYNNAVLAYQSLVKIPYVGPVLGAGAAVAAVAMGMAQVNQIRSQQFSGARKDGGPVVAGQNYLVGEHGPEIITAGATGQVTSYENLQKVFGRDGKGEGNMIAPTLQFQIQALDSKSVAEMLMDHKNPVYQAVKAVLAEEGRSF